MIAKWSRMGDYHASTNGENQDVVCSGENQKYTVISLADGVSTCRKAKMGAQIAGDAITCLLLKRGDYFLDFDKKDTIDITLSHILCELERQKEKDSSQLEEYSSTVASVLFDKENRRLLYFNLGDSVILAAGGGYCRFLAMPAENFAGCPVTTTRGADREVDTRVIDVDGLDSVIICSDGAWRQMVDENRLKPEVSAMLQNGRYEELQAFLSDQDCFDDSSFISMDVRQSTEPFRKTDERQSTEPFRRIDKYQKIRAVQSTNQKKNPGKTPDRISDGCFMTDTGNGRRPEVWHASI
ncbi:MAG: protein phosphatase 2C domain-containing protein [Lachnospiraceae bacterium]|nr:protein phosphatase 2C domain-containing protein [Lachnospiraceae bacterium]